MASKAIPSCCRWNKRPNCPGVETSRADFNKKRDRQHCLSRNSSGDGLKSTGVLADGLDAPRYLAGCWRRGCLRGSFQYPRTETRHLRGSRTRLLFPGRDLSGREVLQAEQSQLETVLHADFLEQPRQIDLDRAFRDQQRGRDLLILKALREQADQLT